MTYGVFEPDTGRKAFVTATCAFDTGVDGFSGTCYTFDGTDWTEFRDATIDVSTSSTIVKIQLKGQQRITFYEADYAVDGDSDCLELGASPSPAPFTEQ